MFAVYLKQNGVNVVLDSSLDESQAYKVCDSFNQRYKQINRRECIAWVAKHHSNCPFILA